MERVLAIVRNEEEKQSKSKRAITKIKTRKRYSRNRVPDQAPLMIQKLTHNLQVSVSTQRSKIRQASRFKIIMAKANRDIIIHFLKIDIP